MVFKFLIGGTSGNLNNAADFGGYYNDTVYAGYESATYSYVIGTYRGDDLIELRDLNTASTALIFAGAGNDTVFGHAGSNNYYDQSGNDIVNLSSGEDGVFLGKGNDKIDGGSGNDFLDLYYINNDFGSTSVNTASITLDLQKTTVQDLGIFGKDIIKNIEFIYGSEGNEKFYGTSGANELFGYGGVDFIDGRGGNDEIGGGEGKDTLVGGTGGDEIYLNEPLVDARDHVRYLKTNESSATSFATGSADWIYNFDKGGGATDDKIDLSRIDAVASSTTYNNTFLFRGVGGAFTSASGEIRIEENGGTSYVYIDTDADASAEMRIVVSGVTGLTAADFIL